MDKYPLISVIIPTYNREKTIHYCLDSVVKQTYKNLEIIISDDCSTDKTLEIVNTYHDDRILIIRAEKNSGAQAARNRGIKTANGKWIAFLDSDDEWLLDKIERQVKELEKHNWNPYLVVHSDAIVYDTINGTKSLLGIQRIHGKNVLQELLKTPAPLFQAMLTSRKVLEEIDYLDEEVPSYQEWDTSIRLAEKCEFVHLDEPTCIYYLHPGKTISKDNMRGIEGYEYIINKFENKIKDNCGNKAWVNHLKIQYIKCLDQEFPDKAKTYLTRTPFPAKFLFKFKGFKLMLKKQSVYRYFFGGNLCK